MAASLTTNSFFAHPDNIILSALYDEDVEGRKIAVETIMTDRLRRMNDVLRQFLLLKEYLNLNTAWYHELVNFNSTPPSFMTEPPLTLDNTDGELQNYTLRQVLPLPDLPF